MKENMENQFQTQSAVQTQVETSEQKIEDGWKESRQNEIISRLLANENLQTILESFPGFKEAFHELDTIDCSDGRVLEGKKIGIAGSGILLSPEERARFVEKYKGRIKEVTTHRDCGAAKIAFNALKPEEIPAGIDNADEYGTWCAKKLAAELEASHHFLEMEDMANEYHNETAIVLDQTARFDSTNLKSFPPHFVCTGAGLGFSEDYMKTELETLTGIALGHHGYGHRFTSENPFYIMVVAQDPASENIWENAANEVAAKFSGRVSVKRVLSPEYKDSEN